MLMNHTQRAQEIHAHSVAAHWWDGLITGQVPEKYFIPTKLCLGHSEVSEAFYGWLEDHADDKLPHRSMLEVELADTAIRLYDIAGYYTINFETVVVPEYSRPNSILGEFLVLHLMISNAMEGHRKQRLDDFFGNIVAAINQCWGLAATRKLDLAGAIDEKRAFNATREDHKIENRTAPEGKGY